MPPPKSKLDPFVDAFKNIGDFDIVTSRAAGDVPDATGHLASRDPRTGLLLKSPLHETFFKTIEVDRSLGMKFFSKNGRIFSLPERPNKDFKPVPEDVLNSFVNMSRRKFLLRQELSR